MLANCALRSCLLLDASVANLVVPLLTARSLCPLQLSDADAPAALPLEEQHEEMESLEEQRQELIGRLVAALGLKGGEAGRPAARVPSVERPADLG